MCLIERVEPCPIHALQPYAGNARRHSKKQIRQIADSIQAFGFNVPILVDDGGTVLAGHGRLEAAKLLGLEAVPTIKVGHLSEAQKRAFILADNKIAQNASWDPHQLAIELQGIIELTPDFEVTLTGFETGEIDTTLQILTGSDEQDRLNDFVAPDPEHPVSRAGDLWLLGEHRLLCGDARDAASYERLLEGRRARLVFADPPYNVRVVGHVVGKGKTQHREFAMASGEMSEDEFSSFLAAFMAPLVGASADGAVHFLCMDWRHIGTLLAVGGTQYAELLNLVVWAKSNGGMGSLYRSQHELIAVFKVGRAPHVNNVQLGRHGRYRTNVWSYPGMNSPVAGREQALALHPTVKPVALVADAIRDCSNRGDLVLDPFCGSGTTLIAAENTGRVAASIELDPLYVDAAVRRWQRATKFKAVHAETGQAFDAMKRGGET